MASASSSEGVARASRAAWLALATILALVSVTDAAVYYGKQDALAAAFPDADEIETKRFFLTEEQRAQIQELANAPQNDRLITAHVGKKGDEILGYAFLETHEVRTLPETILVVVSPEGRVSKILLAAFYEPPEYGPAERWLKQFDDATLEPDLRVNRSIKGIAGSTLTAHAVTSGVRRVLAIYELLIRPEAREKD